MTSAQTSPTKNGSYVLSRDGSILNSRLSQGPLKEIQTHYRLMVAMTPMLMQLEFKIGYGFIFTGFGIEALQFIGLLLNGHFNWGPVFGDVIAKIVYFFNLPFFDRWWQDTGIVAPTIFFWIYFLILAFMTVFYGYLVKLSYVPANKYLGLIGKIVLHLVSSIGVLPMTLTFLSFSVCDNKNKMAFWYPDRTCADGYILAHVVFGVIGMCVLVVWSYVAIAVVYEDSFMSSSISARSTTTPVLCTLLMKIVAGVLYNVLIAKGYPEALAPTLLAFFILNAIQYVVYLPYYNIRVTRWRVASLLVYATFAAVATANVPTSSNWHTRSISTAVVIVVSAVVFLLGWFVLAPVRLNRRYLATAQRLQLQQPVVAEPLFPYGLPLNDGVFSRYPTVERLFQEEDPMNPQDSASREAFSSPENTFLPVSAENPFGNYKMNREEEEMREVDQSGFSSRKVRTEGDYSILDPYIVFVVLQSDVEVATRFLYEYPTYAASSPTIPMIQFAARIYVKGAAKFRSNPDVAYFFAMFLATFGKRQTHALSEIENYVSRLSVSASRFYHISRLVNQTKVSLNLEDAMQVSVIATSTRLHKNVLRIMSSFWAKLLLPNVDTHQLAVVADSITAEKLDCNRSFDRALMKPSHVLLLRYARFLDEILVEPETARMLKNRVTDYARTQMHEEKPESPSSTSFVAYNENPETYRYILDYVKRYQRSTLPTEIVSEATSPLLLSCVVTILFALAFLVAISMLTVILVYNDKGKKSLRQAWVGGKARSMASLLSFYASELRFYESAENKDWAKIQNIRWLIGNYSAAFYSAHTSLTQGALSSSSAEITAVYNDLRTQAILPHEPSISGNFTRSLTTLFQMGFRIVAAANTVATARNGTNSSSLDLEYLVINGPDMFGKAFNSTFTAINNATFDYLIGVTVSLVILGVVMTLVLLGAVAAIRMYVARVVVAKQSTLNLFKLIPRSYVEQILRANQARVDHFDREDRELRSSINELAVVEPVIPGNAEPAAAQGLYPDQRKNSSGSDGTQKYLGGQSTDYMNTSASMSRTVINEEGTQVSRAQMGSVAKEDAYGTSSLQNAGIEDDEYQNKNNPTDRSLIAIWWETMSRTPAFALVLFILLLLAFLTAAAAVVSTACLFAATDDVANKAVDATAISKATREFRLSMDRLTYYAQQYVATGSIVHVLNYSRVLDTADPRYLGEYVLNAEANASQTSVHLQRQALMDSMLLRQSVAMWLASAYYGADAEDIEALDRAFAYKKQYNFTAMAAAVHTAFDSVDLVPSPSPATTDVADSALSPAAKYQVARSLVFDDTYQEHFTLLARLSSNFIFTPAIKLQSAIGTQTRLWIMAEVFLGVSTALAIFILVVYSCIRGSRLVWGLLFLSILVSIAAIVSLSVLHNSTAQASRAVMTELAFDTAMNLTLAEMYTCQREALSYAQFGELKRRNRWFSVSTLNDTQTSLVFATTEMKKLLHKDTVVSFAASIVEVCSSLQRMIYYAMISLTLSSVVYGTYGSNGLPGSDTMVKFDYNRDLEETLELDLATFGWETGIYSSKETDGQLAANAITAIAVNTVSGRRFSYLATPHVSSVTHFQQSLSRLIEGKTLEHRANASTMATVTLTLVSIFTALIIMTLLTVVYFLARQRTVYNIFSLRADIGFRNTIRTPTGGHGLSNWTNRMIYAIYAVLLVIFALTVAFVVLGAYAAIAAPPLRSNLSLATGREWLILEMAAKVQRLWYSTPKGVASSPYKRDVRASLVHLIQVDAEFYLGRNAGRLGALAYLTKNLDLFFGSSTYTGEEFRYPCSSTVPSNGTVTISELVETNATITPAIIQELFSNGLENVLWQWMLSCVEMVDLPSYTDQMKYRPVLTAVVPELVARAQAVSNAYLAECGAVGLRRANAFWVMISLMLFFIIIALFALARPILAHLQEQNVGTVSLLKMIPSNVQRDIPELFEFFKTGSLNEKVERINEACRSTATVSIILIDSDGYILQMSREALQSFQYTAAEVVGKNVNILMPPEVASQHDMYMQRYQQTGVAHKVNRSTRVVAKRKDNSLFLVELTIREVEVSNEKSVFVGRVRNIDVEVELEKVKKIQTSLMELARLPIIITDVHGTILMANSAGCSLFQYMKEELLGANIKKLIPEKHAVVHDEYVFQYMSRRLDLPISLPRAVVGLRKGGEEIPLETVIREMYDDKHVPIMFISYLRDKTGDVVAAQNVLASEVAIEASWIPVIGIDASGIINIFSPAAEKSWGWTASEVIGRNINMLMNEEDARRHDLFLATYLRTGIKHVLSKTRMLVGRRKNGDEFYCEATIRELRREDQISFVGFLKDMTSEMEMLERHTISKHVFTSSPIPIIVIDESGIVQEFSPAAELHLGYAATDVIGRNVSMLLPDSIAHKHDAYLQRYIATGIKTIIDSTRHEYAKCADGQLILVELAVREIFVDDIQSSTGTRRFFVGYIRDCTEEQKMKQTNDKNDALTSVCVVPMVSINSAGTIRTFNHAAELEFGYAAEDIVGRSIDIVVPKFIASKMDPKTGKPNFMDEISYSFGRRSDGAEFPTEVRVAEISRSEIFEPVFVVSTCNISKKVEVENAVSTENASIGAYPLGIITINSTGRITLYSEEASRIFGWSEKEIMGKMLKMVSPMEEDERFDIIAHKFAEDDNQTESKPTIINGRRKNGILIKLELTMYKVRRRAAKRQRGVHRSRGDAGLFIACFLRDLTTEMTLQRSAEIKAVTVEKSMYPIVHFGKKGIITAVNEAFLQEFRFPAPEAVVGRNIDSVVKRGIAANYDRYMLASIGNRTLAANGYTQHVDCALIRCDGTYFPAHVAIRTLRTSLQKPPEIVAFITSTERNVRARTIRAMGEVALAQSPAPIILYSVSGEIKVVNEAAKRLFGYSSEDLLGKHVSTLQPKDAKVMLYDYLQENVGLSSMQFPTHASPFTSPTTVPHAADGEATAAHGAPIHPTENERTPTARVISPPSASSSDQTFHGLLHFNGPPSSNSSNRRSELSPTPPGYGKPDLLSSAAFEAKKKMSYQLRTYAMRKNGEVFQVEFVTQFIEKTMEEDGIPMLITYAVEITDAVRESLEAEVLEAVVAVAPGAVVGCDSNHRFRLFSRRAEELFELSSVEVLGKGVRVLLDASSVAAFTETLTKLWERSRSKEPATAAKQHSVTVRVTAKKHRGVSFPAEVTLVMMHPGTPRQICVAYVRDVSLEIQSEAAARVSSKMINLLSDAFISTNESGIIEDVNLSVTRILGFTRDELVGRNVKMIMPFQVAVHHDNYLQAYLETGKRNAIGLVRYVTARHKDGTEFPVELQLSEMISETVGRRTFYGIMRDCRDEEKLHLENEVCDVVGDLNDQPIISLNSYGSILRFSRGAEELFGYSSQEMFHQHVGKLILFNPGILGGTPDKNVVHPIDNLMNAMREKNRNVGDVSVRGRQKSGVVFECTLTLRASTIIAGLPTYIAFLDTTMLLNRKPSVESYAVAVNSLSLLPVLHTDRHPIVRHVNDAAVAMFGLPKQELIGKNLKDYMPVGLTFDKDEWVSIFSLNETSTTGRTRRITAKRGNGQEALISITIIPIPKDKTFLCFITDITEKVTVENAHQIVQALMTVTPEPIIVANALGSVVTCSSAVPTVIGMKKEKIVGCHLSTIVILRGPVVAAPTQRKQTKDGTNEQSHEEEAIRETTIATVTARYKALTEANYYSTTADFALYPGQFKISIASQRDQKEPVLMKMTVSQIGSSEKDKMYVCFISSLNSDAQN